QENNKQENIISKSFIRVKGNKKSYFFPFL
ncbi:MAG: hypothetical protein ACI8RD_014603, partial [Bacillariaceae sp.]